MEASPLPLDLLLEIFARSDPVTAARCAATCKLLRRHVTDPAFLRRLRASGAAASSDRFLLGLLYHRRRSFWDDVEKSTRRRPLFAAPISSSLPKAVAARLSAELAGPYDPVSSRGGLLVLRRGRRPTRYRVCDPVSGRSHALPPKEIFDDPDLHVVIPDDDEGGGDDIGVPFKLLVADHGIRTQTYSSRAGAWGPVTAAAAAARLPGHYEQVQPSQVVLGGVAHWLYREKWTRTRSYSVLALDVAGTGAAAWIDVPQDCHRRRNAVTGESPRELLLVASAGGELGLLVWERPLYVCMWTVSSSAGGSWARRVVIDRAAILASVRPMADPLECQAMEFQWFAEGSGTVVFHMHAAGTGLLNLRTLEVRRLQRSRMDIFEFSPFCVYELDLASLLRPSRENIALTPLQQKYDSRFPISQRILNLIKFIQKISNVFVSK